MKTAETPLIEVDGFGIFPDHSRTIIRRYTITNKNNAAVRLITLGAGIQSITIPNRTNDMADVILGFDNVKGYLKNRYIGRIVGRVWNPFNKGSQMLAHKEENSDSNQCSFDIVNWESHVLNGEVVMTHLSRDKKEGDLLVQVKYKWTDENQLHVNINATSTKPTRVNISSYCLFNLAGHGMGFKELKNHVVTINANKWITLDLAEGIPSGAIEEVQNTVCDLRCPTLLNSKRLFKVPGGGYNHTLCIFSPSDTWSYRFHGRMFHSGTGRFLEVYSNHPTLQLYTGDDLPNPAKIYPPHLNAYVNKTNEFVKLDERVIGKDGIPYKRHGCFALMPQGFPKAVDCKNFPSNILLPGKIYSHNITYNFGVVV